jgi:hypothetical protein
MNTYVLFIIICSRAYLSDLHFCFAKIIGGGLRLTTFTWRWRDDSHTTGLSEDARSEDSWKGSDRTVLVRGLESSGGGLPWM